ncbi:hypothetical protein WICMUC_002389 [Wickerhamomyces mucosus]|uniref:Uncharacterized protein n=1 Tax=Wickerhamomyces mucosus TaxID=1378264 RepID=A0A9P8PR60_9ASCO|nr:hypothetical protein WICMUC_002389 [Wickerhamomyces mucosus]
MDLQVEKSFNNYNKATRNYNNLIQQEKSRQSLLSTSILFSNILKYNALIDSINSENVSNKTEINKIVKALQADRSSLEKRNTALSNELDNYKKFKSDNKTNQNQSNKEILNLKMQINKLNNQLNESKLTQEKLQKSFATQKAVLESKLETAKKRSKIQISSTPTSTIAADIQEQSSVPNTFKSPSKIIKPHLRKPLVSNFSTSPFLRQRSPVKGSNPSTSTPILNKNLLATSTPGQNLISPIKSDANGNSKTDVSKRSSGLKNLITPAKQAPKKKSSLFDDDDDDDFDIFSNSIKKIKSTEDEPLELKNLQESQQQEQTEGGIKKKRKIITSKAIVENVTDDLEKNEGINESNDGTKQTPLKKVKLMDKLGGISPLKQRNQQRNLFKV